MCARQSFGQCGKAAPGHKQRSWVLSKCIKDARLAFLQLESLLGFRLCFGLGDPFWLSLALYWIRNIYSSPDPPFLSWRYVIHLLFYKESEIEVVALSVR